MIKISNKDLLALYYGSEPVLGIYMNGEKIWPSIILSCFSNGYWIDEYPWTDDLPWTD
jgi:hypothetical protein